MSGPALGWPRPCRRCSARKSASSRSRSRPTRTGSFVPLGADRVLIAASAPRTAELLDDLGFIPVVADISEFEKLEGCVTCLSVLLPGQ